jgi:hypothetical protein
VLATTRDAQVRCSIFEGIESIGRRGRAASALFRPRRRNTDETGKGRDVDESFDPLHIDQPGSGLRRPLLALVLLLLALPTHEADRVRRETFIHG